MNVFIGTSGWIYPHWKKRFYPDGLPARAWLRHAAERLDALEVNATFYGSQRPETFARWREEVAGLPVRFAVKGSRYITHMLKLSQPASTQALANFYSTGPLLLGDALGPFLWQLPPNLGFDPGRMREFFQALPRTFGAGQKLARLHDERFAGRANDARGPGVGARTRLFHALEPRHATFDCRVASSLLEEHDVALVHADTAGVHPEIECVTASFAYIRLHGSQRLYASRYSDRELDVWARRIVSLARRGVLECHVYFDNDGSAYAPHDAMRLRRRLAAEGLVTMTDAGVTSASP